MNFLKLVDSEVNCPVSPSKCPQPPTLLCLFFRTLKFCHGPLKPYNAITLYVRWEYMYDYLLDQYGNYSQLHFYFMDFHGHCNNTESYKEV